MTGVSSVPTCLFAPVEVSCCQTQTLYLRMYTLWGLTAEVVTVTLLLLAAALTPATFLGMLGQEASATSGVGEAREEVHLVCNMFQTVSWLQ